VDILRVLRTGPPPRSVAREGVTRFLAATVGLAVQVLVAHLGRRESAGRSAVVTNAGTFFHRAASIDELFSPWLEQARETACTSRAD
jgi:hypothetical protein